MVIANLFLNCLKGELEMRKEEVLLVLS
ncbi:hypothetical protein [Bacillus sp. 1NLA3E]|nr:hypothetical protein [Bacillus sp. 1NLA3E]